MNTMKSLKNFSMKLKLMIIYLDIIFIEYSEEQTNDVYAERIKNDYFPDERNIIIDVNDFFEKG